MSGRGRGRGRGSIPFKSGFGNSEDLLPPLNQPPAIYPPLQFKPVPLLTGNKIQYTLTLKQEIRSSFKESGYYIPPVSVKKDIERYTDKYQQIHAADQVAWDKDLFPKELFEQPRKKRKIAKASPRKEEAIVEKLKVLEEKEEKEEVGEEGEEEKEEEKEEDELQEENEEELEEETDYASNYFDNGENYLDDEDDNADDGYEY